MSLTTRIVITAQDNASRQFGNISQNGLRATGSLLKVNKTLMQTNQNIQALSNNKALIGGGIFAGLIANLKSFTTSAIDVKVDFDRIRNTLLGVTGSAHKAGEELAFLTSESKRLGIELRPLGQSYARLLASTTAMGISVNDSRLIFTSFAQAITGMGASREQAIRIFSAIDQMASKGCHAKGSLISMYDGSLKVVEDIKVGEFLLGDKLDPKEVITLAHGKEEMYTIIPDVGKPFIVNKNHKLCLNINNEQSVVILKDYLKNDYQGKEVYLAHIDNNKKVSFKVEFFGVDDFYGFFISGNHLYLDYQGFIHHNTVSMEELKQQLGEALPGVLQIAAKSMGMTTEAFTKLVAQGKVASKDFLLPFAKGVNEAFGGIAVSGSKLLNAELNRLINTMNQVKLAYIEGGKEGEFLAEKGSSLADSLALIIKKVNDLFGNKDKLKEFASLGSLIGKTLVGLADIILGLTTVLQPLINMVNAVGIGMGASILGTITFTLALKGLISTARLAGNILGNLSGKKAGVASALSGGSTAGGSRFQELMQLGQYSNYSPKLKDSGNIYGNGIPNSNSYQNFRNSTANSFVNSRSTSFGSAKYDESAMTTLKNSANNLNNSKFGLAVSSVATKLFSLVNPITLVVGAISALASALSHWNDTKNIQKSADSQDRVTKAKADILKDMSPDMKNFEKSFAAGASNAVLKTIIDRLKNVSKGYSYTDLNSEEKAIVDNDVNKWIAKYENKKDSTFESKIKEQAKAKQDFLDKINSQKQQEKNEETLAKKLGITAEEFRDKYAEIYTQMLEALKEDTFALKYIGDKIKEENQKRINELNNKKRENAEGIRKGLIQDKRSLGIQKLIPDDKIASLVDSYARKVQNEEISQEHAVFLINQEMKIIELNEQFIKSKEDRLALEERLKNRPEFQELSSISASDSSFKTFRARSMFDKKADNQMDINKKKIEDKKKGDKAKTDEAILKLPNLLEGLNDAVKNLFGNVRLA